MKHTADQLAPSVSSAATPSMSPAVVLETRNPHFDKLGGAEAVVALVDAFYEEMDTQPGARGIRALHPQDLTPVKQVLVRYLTEWLGGPALYSVERGHPRLRRRHLPFAIGEAERDAWMSCMSCALERVCPDPSLRNELTQAFMRTADFLRNQ